MPAAVAVPILQAAIPAAASIFGAKSQSGANKRALAASNTAAQRAEAFERDQDAKNRADDAKRDAEDKRRWDIEQANVASVKAEQDARQRYEDQVRYRKMVNIAQLTGQPMPDPLPSFGGGSGGSAPPMTIGGLSRGPVSQPMMSAPSRTNAMIAAPPDPLFNPLAAAATAPNPLAAPAIVANRVPLSKLAGRRF